MASSMPSEMITPPPDDDHRELRLAEELGRLIEALLGAGTAGNALRARDLAVDLAIEVVARDVELGGPALGHRHVEAARGELGHARMLFTWPWYLVILEKIGSCSVSWKPPRPMVPEPVSGVTTTTGECAQIGRRGRGHEVGDAGTVLGDAHAMAAGDARSSRRPCGPHLARVPSG